MMKQQRLYESQLESNKTIIKSELEKIKEEKKTGGIIC